MKNRRIAQEIERESEREKEERGATRLVFYFGYWRNFLMVAVKKLHALWIFGSEAKTRDSKEIALAFGFRRSLRNGGVSASDRLQGCFLTLLSLPERCFSLRPAKRNDGCGVYVCVFGGAHLFVVFVAYTGNIINFFFHLFLLQYQNRIQMVICLRRSVSILWQRMGKSLTVTAIHL